MHWPLKMPRKSRVKSYWQVWADQRCEPNQNLTRLYLEGLRARETRCGKFSCPKIFDLQTWISLIGVTIYTQILSLVKNMPLWVLLLAPVKYKTGQRGWTENVCLGFRGSCIPLRTQWVFLVWFGNAHLMIYPLARSATIWFIGFSSLVRTVSGAHAKPDDTCKLRNCLNRTPNFYWVTRFSCGAGSQPFGSRFLNWIDIITLPRNHVIRVFSFRDWDIVSKRKPVCRT